MLKNEFENHEWKGECLEHNCLDCIHADNINPMQPCTNCINNVTACYFVEKEESK